MVLSSVVTELVTYGIKSLASSSLLKGRKLPNLRVQSRKIEVPVDDAFDEFWSEVRLQFRYLGEEKLALRDLKLVLTREHDTEGYIPIAEMPLMSAPGHDGFDVSFELDANATKKLKAHARWEAVWVSETRSRIATALIVKGTEARLQASFEQVIQRFVYSSPELVRWSEMKWYDRNGFRIFDSQRKK